MSASFDDSGPDSSGLDAEVAAWLASERELLGSVLLGAGTISADGLTDVLRHAPDDRRRIGEQLIVQAGITEQQVAEGIATQFGIRHVDLQNETPEPAALDLVGEEACRRLRVVPMYLDEERRCWIAMADPLDGAAIIELVRVCTRIGLMVAAPSAIDAVLESSFDSLHQAELLAQAFELVDGPVVDADTLDATDSHGGDDHAPIVQLVNRILAQGVRRRASDIHLEPQANGVRVRLRIDGALSDALTLPARMGPGIASRIKVMADLNIVERRRPQDGQFSVKVDGRPIDIRTSVVATVHGEKLVLRLLDTTRSLISLAELGMPESLHGPYLSIARAPLGMVLCTGPTGSGKTTTLYATLAEVNDPTRNVVTIEDPVEYQFAGVNQMQVHEAAGITFANGLRGILRQDPDIILVGEIRDIDTARIATQAALTGHFVLSSLHAVDAVSALHRFTDMGIEPFLVASAINGVVGQRLLRRVCSNCRIDTEPSADQIAMVESGLGAAAPPGPRRWSRGAGCRSCAETGFRGRIGVYELLRVTDAIREQIVGKSTHSEMRRTAIAEGMRTMQQEAFSLVATGVTTVDEVLRGVYAPSMDLEPDEPAVVLARRIVPADDEPLTDAHDETWEVSA